MAPPPHSHPVKLSRTVTGTGKQLGKTNYLVGGKVQLVVRRSFAFFSTNLGVMKEGEHAKGGTKKGVWCNLLSGYELRNLTHG